MPSLQRAVAIPAVHHVAVRIGQDLHLDVPWPLDVLLEINARVLECGRGLGTRHLQRAIEVRLVAADAHTLAPTPRGGLDEHWKADRPGKAEGFSIGADGTVGPGHQGDLGRGGNQLGLGLKPHLANRLMRRTDELEVATATDLRKLWVFAQKAIAGMDRLDIGHLGRGNQAGNVEIAVDTGGLADANGSIGKLKVRSIAVRLGIDGDHLDAQLLARADDAEGDFTSVGYQDPLKHREGSLMCWGGKAPLRHTPVTTGLVRLDTSNRQGRRLQRLGVIAAFAGSHRMRRIRMG